MSSFQNRASRMLRSKRKPDPAQPVPVPGRECGPCTACCTVMGVRELPKDPWKKCEHVCAAGCAVYEERPPSCAEYLCGWRYGIGEDADRPDRLGVVLSIESHPSMARFALGKRPPKGDSTILVARESWRMAANSPRALRLLAAFRAQQVSVIILRSDQSSIIYGEAHPEGYLLQPTDESTKAHMQFEVPSE